MKYWLITDTHFSHKRLIDFGRPEDFEEQLKNNMSKMIGEDDMLIHLGDVCIGNDIENNMWFSKYKNVLVKGNHDHKSVNWYLNHGWDFVCKRFDFKMFGKRIAFTHQPEAWDGYFDLNIHGHFHDTDGRRQPDFNEGTMSGYNKLLAVEYTDYKPVNLEKFIT